ncbi:Uncharacterised protein [Neisseria gonorrhoeae]|uniref:Uncharacterized protein n=1 Tax=Neisseria gonorrhoeae TaxID=485 RepID=A0A378VZ27_NEIGO|nr:Uncharacterised protein [Neisseria gonorrhoeae]
MRCQSTNFLAVAISTLINIAFNLSGFICIFLFQILTPSVDSSINSIRNYTGLMSLGLNISKCRPSSG